MTITIPAAVLKQLGGLRETDAPVLWGGPMTAAGKTTMMYDFTHPIASPTPPMGRLILPSSSAALLCVLARHVGLELAEGEVPAWQYKGLWDLETTRRRVNFGTAENGRSWVAVPTLTPGMTRMCALAETVVWLARLERLRAAGWVWDAWVRGPEQRARLGASAVEQRLDLPPWTVEER